MSCFSTERMEMIDVGVHTSLRVLQHYRGSWQPMPIEASIRAVARCIRRKAQYPWIRGKDYIMSPILATARKTHQTTESVVQFV